MPRWGKNVPNSFLADMRRQMSLTGNVPGQFTGQQDTVQARLTPGEFVVPRNVAQQLSPEQKQSLLGGQTPNGQAGTNAWSSPLMPQLNTTNQSPARYQEGGDVLGDAGQMDCRTNGCPSGQNCVPGPMGSYVCEQSTEPLEGTRTLQDLLDGEGFGDFSEFADLFGDDAGTALAERYGVSADVAKKYVLPFEKDRFNKMLATIPKWKQEEVFNITKDFQMRVARKNEEQARVTGQTDIAKQRTDEMDAQTLAIFGKEMTSEQYANLDSTQQAQYFNMVEETLGETVTIGGLTGKQLSAERRRLEAEFGDEPGSLGGLLGAEFEEAKLQTEAMYGEKEARETVIEGAEAVGGFEGARLKEIRKQLEYRYGADLAAEGLTGGAASRRLDEMAKQISEEYGDQEGELAGLKGEELTERQLRITNQQTETEKRLEAQYGKKEVVDPETGEVIETIGGTVKKKLDVAQDRQTERQRQLTARTEEETERLEAQYGEGEIDPITKQPVSALAGITGQQIQDRARLAEEASRREFVTGTQGLRESMLQQSMQQRIAGPQTRGFAAAGGQSFMQQMQKQRSDEAYTNLRSSLAASADEIKSTRDIQERQAEEARRRGYASVEEARLAGESGLDIAKSEIDIAKEEAKEAKRAGFASTEEAARTGTRAVELAEDAALLQAGRERFAYTEEELQAEEMARAGKESLLQQVGRSGEAARAAEQARVLRENRAREAAKAGREGIGLKALEATERQRQAGEQADIARSVAEEARRAGQTGVDLTEMELKEAKRRSLAGVESEEQRRYAEVEGFLSDYIKGSQSTALRLLEMGYKTEDEEDDDTDRCPQGTVRCPEGSDLAGSCQPTSNDCYATDPDPQCGPEPIASTNPKAWEKWSQCMAGQTGDTIDTTDTDEVCDPACTATQTCVDGTCVETGGGEQDCMVKCQTLTDKAAYEACVAECAGTSPTPPTTSTPQQQVCEKCLADNPNNTSVCYGEHAGSACGPQAPVTPGATPPPTTPTPGFTTGPPKEIGMAYGGTVPQGSFLNDMLVRGFGGRK